MPGLINPVVVEVRTQFDWERVQSASPGKHLLVRLLAKSLVMPQAGYVWRRSNVIFEASGAPGGYCLFHQGCFSLVGTQNIHINRVAFRVNRPIGLPQGALEKSWKAFRIHAESPDAPCEDITLENCSFSGHTDELEVGPADHDWWYANHISRIAARNIKFLKCMFAYPLVNYTRGPHNMSISCSCVENVLCEDTVYVGANRRSPQWLGSLICRHTVLIDWGTMGAGIHCGSRGEFQACHFIPGPHTKATEMPITMVEGSYQSACGPLGTPSLAITKNTRMYSNLRTMTVSRQGWDCFGQDPLNPPITKITASAVPVLKDPFAVIRAAGAGDALDVVIRDQLVNKRAHIPWNLEYTAPFTFPIR